MKTRRLTELLVIEVLSASTTNSGEVVESYSTYKTVYGSILNDNLTDNNQQSNTTFENGLQYSDRIRFYIRFLQITLTNRIKKQYRITHNGNYYYITGIKPVANRSATIIECSSTV